MELKTFKGLVRTNYDWTSEFDIWQIVWKYSEKKNTWKYDKMYVFVIEVSLIVNE